MLPCVHPAHTHAWVPSSSRLHPRLFPVAALPREQRRLCRSDRSMPPGVVSVQPAIFCAANCMPGSPPGLSALCQSRY